jgi:site-specific DNA-methyltransferase (cytosine-N4-specific)
MPESVTDRLSTKHEHLFLFSKSRRYWFDLDPIREPTTGQPQVADLSGRPFMPSITGKCGRGLGAGRAADHELGRNPGDVWTIPTQPFPGAHFATFPVELPRRCIAAGCKPGGVVLDPFSGSGTTGLAAAELGRRYVGIDINADYLELSLRTRLRQPSLTAEGGGAA